MMPDNIIKKFKLDCLFYGRDRGGSLIATLVSLGILSLSVYAATTGMTNISKARSHLELRESKDSLKSMIIQSTDCDIIPTCNPNQLISLISYDGRTLVSSNGNTRHGRWTVRAQCQNDRTFGVRVALVAPDNSFLNDPLTGHRMDWNASSGVLIQPGLLCGEITPTNPNAPFTVRLGNVCVGEVSGTCPHPYGLGNMCCDDGRNATKPSCPNGSREESAYWDRQDDWGANGQWVVICR